MPITLVHISDIHFGQEKGGTLIIHNDVKECLIADAAAAIKKYAGGHATGIIVTGDIAYAGKREEYDSAAEWMDRLAAAIGCAKTAVQVVPGNHDIDRKAISSGCRWMLSEILRDGQAQLDTFLANELDREVLNGRFSAYRPFAEGYNCPMDRLGGFASDRTWELAPGRTLRFIGLNSALTCSEDDIEGNLILGEAQHVLPRTKGEELVVLSHHPLHWLRDSEPVRDYVRSRARVLVSGHEHAPSLSIERIKDGCDLMLIAAGATVPPKAENGFTYTYNILTFDWDAATDGLKVTIVPRCWSKPDTDFTDDAKRLSGQGDTILLGCPNFRNGTAAQKPVLQPSVYDVAEVSTVEKMPAAGQPEGNLVDDDFALLLLRFFRDLTPGQRLTVLASMKALPDDWSNQLTHSLERRIVDSFAKTGRLKEFSMVIDEVLAKG